MKKALIALILFVLFILLLTYSTHATSKCIIEIHNLSTENTIYYWVYWVDHPHSPELIGPMDIMGGELEPEGKVLSDYTYSNGHYFIEWRDKDKCCSPNYEEFNIGPATVKVIIGVSEKLDSFMLLELFGV